MFCSTAKHKIYTDFSFYTTDYNLVLAKKGLSPGSPLKVCWGVLLRVKVSFASFGQDSEDSTNSRKNIPEHKQIPSVSTVTKEVYLTTCSEHSWAAFEGGQLEFERR